LGILEGLRESLFLEEMRISGKARKQRGFDDSTTSYYDIIIA
jgi:hypothetical protein